MGVAVTVDDSTTTEPCEVTVFEVINVDVDTAVLLWLETEDAEEATEEALLALTPVERLTCLFSCLANAASIS